MESNRIEITSVRNIENKRFKVDSTEFNLHFKKSAFEDSTFNRQDVLMNYNNCFRDMLQFVDGELEVGKRDLIGIKFQIPTMESVSPFGMRYLERQELNSEMISDLLYSVQQSNSVFEDKNLLEVNVTVIHNDTGGARVSLHKLNLDNYNELQRVKSRSILKIPNESDFNDKKCLPRALILGKEWIDCEKDKRKFQNLFRKHNEKLMKLTNQLILRTFGTMKNFEQSHCGAILPDILQFKKKLSSYQIVVYDDKNLHKAPVYSSTRKKNKINIFFLTQQQHFIALSNVTGFFGMQFLCEYCGYMTTSSVKYHRCAKVY